MEDINLSQTPTFSENYTINEQSDFGFKQSYINGQFYHTVNDKINNGKDLLSMCIMLNKKHHKYMGTAMDTIKTHLALRQQYSHRQS